jgi:hypothetical protein
MATIEARVTAVEQEVGNDWIRVRTDHPQVKRLDTKDQDRAQQAVAARNSGEIVLINYTQRPSRNVNPHTGQPYQDYYFDGVLAGGGVQRTNGAHSSPTPQGIDMVPQGQATQGTGRRTDPEDAWRMTLAKSAELAVRTLPLLDDQSPEAQWRLTLWWANRIYTTPMPGEGQIQPAHDPGFATTPSGPGAYQEPDLGYDQPPPRGDDDIPF